MTDLKRITYQALASACLCANLLACGRAEQPSLPSNTLHDASNASTASDASAPQASVDAAGTTPTHDASTTTWDAGGPNAPTPRAEAGVQQDGATAALDAALNADAATLDAASASIDAAGLVADAGLSSDASTTDAAADSALPADLGVDISLVSLSGTLCPKDSWNASISGDKHAVTVTFAKAELQAQSSEGLEASCRLTFDLRVPKGYQFSQAVIAPSGYTFSDRGAANLLLSYAFPAFPPSGAQQTFKHRDIPSDTDFVFRDRVDSVWSPTCDASSAEKPLRLALEFTLSARVDAYINVSSLDFDFALQTGNIAFRACP